MDMVDTNMVDMDMVDMDMVDVDMVDVDMVDVDMVDVDMVNRKCLVKFIYLGSLPRIIFKKNTIRIANAVTCA